METKATKKTTTKKTSAVVTATKPTVRRRTKTANEIAFTEQIKATFAPKNRFAAVCGFIMGGFVPVATFFMGHVAAAANPLYYILVVAGLMYSALTVYEAGLRMFKKSKFKSGGFVILVEGIMTLAPHSLLALAVGALTILVIINGVMTACNLISEAQEKKAAELAAA